MTEQSMSSLTDAQMLDYLRTNVYLDGDCRIWAGPFARGDGYPQIYIARQARSARRLLATLSGKTVTRRYRVSAACGNEHCMAEAHIRVETLAASLRRYAAEGMFPTGAQRTLAVAMGRAPRAKFGITQARTVEQMRRDGVLLKDIASRYDVTVQSVSSSIKRWRKVGVIA